MRFSRIWLSVFLLLANLWAIGSPLTQNSVSACQNTSTGQTITNEDDSSNPILTYGYVASEEESRTEDDGQVREFLVVFYTSNLNTEFSVKHGRTIPAHQPIGINARTHLVFSVFRI
ncbi:MAG: hypothetical protein GC181_15145 [Bacteroidetes bacterium]|nr:hypothetical protein [Bacteroidota bacterium]